MRADGGIFDELKEFVPQKTNSLSFANEAEICSGFFGKCMNNFAVNDLTRRRLWKSELSKCRVNGVEWFQLRFFCRKENASLLKRRSVIYL